jgi:cyclophilin family peptidyl-prolyl cis-trans isomerase
MANAGPNTNGSQFFIVMNDLSGKIPARYTIFGEVIEGWNILSAIGSGAPDSAADAASSPSIAQIQLERVQIDGP